MTLRFFHNSTKPDTRQTDYERSMVQLGLAKAALEREADRVRGEVADLNGARDKASLAVQECRDEVARLEQKAIELRQEIADAVLKGSHDTVALREREKASGKAIEERQSELTKLDAYLVSLDEQIQNKNLKLADLQATEAAAREELGGVQLELSRVKRELEVVTDDVRALFQLKLEVSLALNDASTERREVEAIVEMLKQNNKDGLELVASFEGERNRLKEKENFLRRKEDDLAVYEHRLQKRMDEAGIKSKMVFK